MNTGPPESQGQKIHIPWRLYLVIGFLTLLVVGAMVFILQQTKNISAANDHLLECVSEIELKVTTAHLWLEEILSGDNSEKIETVREILDEAEWHLHGLIGKKVRPGEHVRLGVAPETRKNHGRFHLSHASHAFHNIKEPLEAVEEKLNQFRATLEKRYLARQTSTSGTEIDRRFDRIFAELLKGTGEIKKKNTESKLNHLAEFRIIQTSLIFICLVLAAFIVVILHRLERRKAADLLAVIGSEEALRKSEERYRSIYNNTPVMLHSIDRNGQIVSVSDYWLDTIGYERSEVIGCKFVEFLTKESRKYAEDVILPEYYKTGFCKDVPFQFVNKNGEVIDVLHSAISEKDKEGDVIHSLAVLNNVTELNQAKEALQWELNVNFALAELSTELISSKYDIKKLTNLILEYAKNLTDSEYGYVSVINQDTLENVAYTLTNMIAGECQIENKRIAFPVGHDGKYNGLGGHALNTLKPFYTNDPQSHPNSKGTPRGHIPLKSFLTVPVKIENKLAGQIALANSRTVYTQKHIKVIERLGELYALALQREQIEKEKEKLQTHLNQAQKMEAIGTLAGGIAHDFNNILFPIFGYVEMIIEDTAEDSPQRYMLNEVLKAAKRARDLARQILTFSRQSNPELKPLEIRIIVREVLKLIRSTLPSTIEIRQNLNHKCGLVLADPTQIHQVAMNLITNAYHAMEETCGKLEVTLKEVELEVDDLKDQSIIPGPYVCLTVADTGIGMEKSVLDRIFDPYFTTKAKDKGTGLGLSVVHGIVKRYGGDIRVYSEPDKGTVFHVYLPVIKTQVETKEIDAITSVQKGTERILLVDDEEPIVQVEKQMLERLDYHVTARTSSIEALEAFKANPGKFDLVITDMTMPNITGIQLAKKLLEVRSDIPIIICTGFSEQISDEKAKVIGISGYVMKPVLKSELAKKIREVLDQD